MKAVILAGGLGTRLSEETDLLPKPLVHIGERPILWHIMHIYAAAGVKDFVVCCGYKGNMIKRYFANYFLETADIIVHLAAGDVEYLNTEQRLDWRVACIDTGAQTMTGGRVKRVAPYIQDGTFCLTYGDGLADIDIGALIAFHKGHGKLATVTAVPSPGRFGILDVREDDMVRHFMEKPSAEMGWINGGFFVLEPGALDYIEGDGTVWERTALERLARDGQLVAYKHTGFWKPMDMLRDKRDLEELWATNPPWRVW